MQWSDIPFHPPTRTVRQFAGLWVLVFTGMALWQGLVHGHRTAGIVCAVLAGGMVPLAMLFPVAVRWLFVGWMVLIFPIGWVVSSVLLGALYYGLITPVGLIFRLIGRDALRLRRPVGAETCWTPKVIADDLRRYFRQY